MSTRIITLQVGTDAYLIDADQFAEHAAKGLKALTWMPTTVEVVYDSEGDPNYPGGER